MSVLGLIIVILLIGLLAWAIQTYAPISPGFKKLIFFILIAVAILLTLQAFGLLGALNTAVPHVR